MCVLGILNVCTQQCVGCESISTGNSFITWRSREYNTFVLFASSWVNFVWQSRCLQVSKGHYLDLLYYFMYSVCWQPYSSAQFAFLAFNSPTSHSETHVQMRVLTEYIKIQS